MNFHERDASQTAFQMGGLDVEEREAKGLYGYFTRKPKGLKNFDSRSLSFSMENSSVNQTGNNLFTCF